MDGNFGSFFLGNGNTYATRTDQNRVNFSFKHPPAQLRQLHLKLIISNFRLIQKLLPAKVSVVGLGYVGLPVAVAFGKSGPSSHMMSMQLV